MPDSVHKDFLFVLITFGFVESEDSKDKTKGHEHPGKRSVHVGKKEKSCWYEEENRRYPPEMVIRLFHVEYSPSC